MKTLLRIDTSPRVSDSHSRALADFAESAWRTRFPHGQVIVRDLRASPPPHLTESTVAAFFTPPEARGADLQAELRLSDQLIDEFVSADAVLLSTPLYNFSLPSVLKAYFDQIVRIGKTFDYSEQRGLFGTVPDRPVWILLAYGAAGYEQGPLSEMDFAKPYLVQLLRFLGISDVRSFVLEGTTTNPDAIAEAKRNMQQHFAAAAAQLV